ncbi:hypothetical protein CANCADRAFT_44225 [Tortispora caseinolytica NRRL Y-17796]|uniref:FAD/NAD(P)-binding domain-containing protein n=1 Tax=Tortispora caseinolytica NRRL Y-17796 TaxID=767744 RepID=A0A1E4TFP7_9ASCO|nr:hypothetical protein CANCADRAFT_44225 [Tortispora caseinolytica NRRL Y-17796]
MPVKPQWLQDDISRETTDDPNIDWYTGGVYKSLYTNIAESYMTFSFDPTYNSRNQELYPFNYQESVSEYLNKVAGQLSRRIRYLTKVDWIDKTDENQWKVSYTVTDSVFRSITTNTETFDAVVIASGAFHYPMIPQIPLLNNFKGRIEHTINYKADIQQYIGKKVLIVGSSFSAIDCIRDLAPYAEIHLSKRSSHWYYPWFKVVCDTAGIALRRPAIKQVDDKGNVHFSDGTYTSYDVIIFATGYISRFPFINDKYIHLSDDSSYLQDVYLMMFSIEDPTLSFVGLSVSSIMFRGFELQAKIVAAVYANKVALPPQEVQRQWFQDRIAKFKARNITVSKFQIIADDELEEYINELSRLAPQCRTDYKKKTTELTVEAMILSIELFFFKLLAGIEDALIKLPGEKERLEKLKQEALKVIAKLPGADPSRNPFLAEK